MGVYDRWHKSRPAPGESPCREHKMAPAAGHGEGERWQVRWRDHEGQQRKRNFARKTGADPEKCADAFDAKVRRDLDTGSYIDPSRASVTFREYAEDWRKTRTHDTVTAERLERELRLHTYPAIGHRPLRELAQRPSLTQAWIAGLKLAPSSALQLVNDISSVYIAAIDDGLIGRNPVRAKSVTRPKPAERKARPWTLAQVEAMAAALPARYAVLPWLGAGTGMRQGELFGLAAADVVFLGRRPVVHVRRQVKLIGAALHFAPIKNGKEHDVPLSKSVAPVLAEHMRLYPPVTVTLPWHEPENPQRHGRPVTFRLLVTRPDGQAMHRTRFNTSAWWPAQQAAGITPERERGQKREAAREDGMHVLRHTAASAWLSAGVDIASVAAWLGDTKEVVLKTYAHMMPDADDRGRAAMDVFFSRPEAPIRNAEGEAR